MTKNYLDLAQRALTPEELMTGLRYIEGSDISEGILTSYYSKWVQALGSIDKCKKRAKWSGYTVTSEVFQAKSKTRTPPEWLYCWQDIMTLIESKSMEIKYRKYENDSVFTSFFVTYIKERIDRQITEAVLDPYFLLCQQIIHNISAPTLNHMYLLYQYNHKMCFESKDMYDHFMEDVLSNPMLHLAPYSYLCRLLAEFCISAARNINLFLKRVSQQFSEDIIRIIPFQSDLHNHFQSTIIFALASNRTVVYKPRTLAAEKGFYEFISSYASKLTYAPMIIDYKDYGFMEYIPYEEVKEETQLNQYFNRAGQLLELIVALEGFDFHHENIIAKGSYPVPIDLETLMHPKVFYDNEEDVYRRTGMINSLYSAFDYPRDDIGRVKKSLPSYSGNFADRSQYNKAFNNGREMMKQQMIDFPLLDNKAYVGLQQVETRVILRATRIYEELIIKSLSPGYLRNGFERSLFFEILFVEPLSREVKPTWWHLIEVEKEQLIGCNIPYIMKEESIKQWRV